MNDLIADMVDVASRLDPPTGAVGRAVQFVASRSGDGVSTLARAFALAVSPMSKRGVWLVELDLLSGAQVGAIATQPEVFGLLGPAVRASPDGSSFFMVRPQLSGKTVPDASYLLAHSVGPRRLWVTRFQQGALDPGQTVEMRDTADYWQALRQHADWIVVDAPALERSRAGLIAAPRMDGNILVIDAGRGDLAGDRELRDQILNSGGRISGAVLNRSPDNQIKANPLRRGSRK